MASVKVDWSKPITYMGKPAEYLCQHKDKRVVCTNAGGYYAFNEDGTYGEAMSGIQHIQNVPPPKKTAYVVTRRWGKKATSYTFDTFGKADAYKQAILEDWIATTEIEYDAV